MKILLGMPVYSGIHPETVKNLIDFDIHAQQNQNDLDIYFPRGSILSQSRNLIMRKGLSENADWVLMWDSDIAVPDKTFLQGMLQTAYDKNAAIVGLPVKLKAGEIYNVAIKTGKEYRNLVWDDIGNNNGLSSLCDVIGTGVMLIRMSWIRDHFPKGPWFSTIDTETGCFPEDWTFCERITDRHGKIYVDTRYKTIHYGEKGFES